MTVTGDARRDLAQLEAMVETFGAYLDGDAPYREVAVQEPSGAIRTTTMSIGLLLDLLEALEREADGLSPDERERLVEARRWFNALRHGRPTDYARLLGRELKGQVDAWQWYLEDCQRGEKGSGEAYSAEARKRSRIAQLLEEARGLHLDVGDAARRIDGLDRALRALLQPGSYCGPAHEGHRYPAERFWWLYGRPRARGRDA